MDEEARLLARIAKLSSAINQSQRQQPQQQPQSRPRAASQGKTTRHLMWVRPQEAPAAVADAMIPVEAPVAVSKPVLKTSYVATAPAMVKKKKKKKAPPASASAPPPAKNRVAVFVDSVGYRKTNANVLTRSESVGNKTLKVPKQPRQKPHCLFFLRGECTREDCPYSHVHVNKGAAVCADFLDGHCPAGDGCAKKHVLVCEYDAESCPEGDACRLRHRPRRKRTLDEDGEDDKDEA